MAAFIVLANLTDDGGANFKEAYAGIRNDVEASIEGREGRIRGWTTSGPYGAVELVDPPGEEALRNWILGSASSTSIRTITMRAFSEDEVKEALE